MFVIHNKRKVINACRGAIEQAEAVDACRSFEGGGALAIDEYGVTHIAHHQIILGRGVVQAAIVGKALILNYNGDICFTQAQIKFLGKGFFLVITYNKEGCQPHVCLFCGQAMRMRMVPVSARPVCDGEGIFITALGPNGICWMPCLLPGAIHAVPMNDGRLIQAINKCCFKGLAFAQYKDGVQIRLAIMLGCIG